MYKSKNKSVVISNKNNEPFLLPIDISQYGQYVHDELEIRVCNDYIEVSGKQEWRMAAGGANRRMFAQRHVLPDYIDLKAVYCRLLDSKTILVSAPSLSIVSRLTNSNQLKVDYMLGLDSKGYQFLKRYNSTNQATKSRTSKEKLNHPVKSSGEDVSHVLFDLVKNPSKGSSNSKLFASVMGQRNVNFVNNLKRSSLKVPKQKVYLNVDQLMKESGGQTAIKKSKKRRSRKKKSADQSLNDKDEVKDEKVEKTLNEESKSSVKKSIPKRKKDTSTSSTGKRKSESISVEDKKSEGSSSSDSIVDKKSWAVIKRDEFVKKELISSSNDASEVESAGDAFSRSESSKESESSKGTSLISSTSTSESDGQPLTSCLKESHDDKNESKIEKHVVIAEPTQD